MSGKNSALMLAVLLTGAACGAAPIHDAAGRGDLERIQLEIEWGERIDARARRGMTPLMIAAQSRKGTPEAIELLVSLGAAIDAQDGARRTALHHAAEHGDAERVRILLELGADPSAIDGSGATPLLLAAGQPGAAERVRILLGWGANPDAMTTRGESALMRAVIANEPDNVQALLEAGARAQLPDRTEVAPIHVAAGRGATEVVKLLLDAGAELESLSWRQYTPLMEAVAGASPDTIDLLLERGASIEATEWTPLFRAVVDGDADALQAAIDSGADVNERDKIGRTPVMYAAMYNRPQMVERLVAAGADVNTTDAQRDPAIMFAAMTRRGREALQAFIDAGADVNVAAPFGTRPIHVAIDSGDPDRVEMLVNAGAKLEINSPGFEPTLTRAVDSTPEMVNMLLGLGADLNTSAIRGSTALHLAAGRESTPVETLMVLISAGADLEARDDEGRTPLDYAVQDATVERVRLLLDAGAKPRGDRHPTTLDLARQRMEGDSDRTEIIALIEEALAELPPGMDAPPSTPANEPPRH